MNEFAICESVCVVRYQSTPRDATVQSFVFACGLRNGILKLLVVDLDTESGKCYPATSLTNAFHRLSLIVWVGGLVLGHQKTIRMGEASAKVVPDNENKHCAFVTCGAEFCRIVCQPAEKEPQISNIWLTDDDEVVFL